MKEFEIGSIVKVVAGKEKNENFIIFELSNNKASLVNGKSRKIEKPKQKNLKHIYFLKDMPVLKEKILENKLFDCDIIKILKDYNQEKNV